LKKEIQLLEEFQARYMVKTIKTIEFSLAEGLIKADDLWSLFPVGSKIILQNRNTTIDELVWCVVVNNCFEVGNKESDGKEPKPEAVWEVEVEFTGFNGKNLFRVQRSFQIGGFKGVRQITSLPAFPLDLHPQKEKLEQRLVDRGKIYVDLCVGESYKSHSGGKGSHQEYSGLFWRIKPENHGESSVDFFGNPDYQVCLLTRVYGIGTNCSTA
jgi:hypothetical protein